METILIIAAATWVIAGVDFLLAYEKEEGVVEENTARLEA
jgi:hypothetical protein